MRDLETFQAYGVITIAMCFVYLLLFVAIPAYNSWQVDRQYGTGTPDQLNTCNQVLSETTTDYQQLKVKAETCQATKDSLFSNLNYFLFLFMWIMGGILGFAIGNYTKHDKVKP